MTKMGLILPKPEKTSCLKGTTYDESQSLATARRVFWVKTSTTLDL